MPVIPANFVSYHWHHDSMMMIPGPVRRSAAGLAARAPEYAMMLPGPAGAVLLGKLPDSGPVLRRGAGTESESR